MADNYQGGFENQDFDDGLEQILEEQCEHVVSDRYVVKLPTEDALQEVVVSAESHHDLNNVTNPAPIPSSEEQSHKLPDGSNVHIPEQGYDEGGLTAWTDSQIRAWDQVSFSASESEEEEEEELPHEIRQELFREHDLNRRLEYDMLRCVNWNFETLFDLNGQTLSYREAEDIVASAQSDVVSILRNIIACQQQHNESLRHTAEFWRSCMVNFCSFNRA
ncbi:hypothetical protein cypCar_00046664 [Cyprinus carpio]|nr:hypothetical protein cypCar_00046664 [Cyprinus carpio]